MENLHFKGHWRDYQKRILERSRDYMADGQVHISAAPGSGKTTLGIEFIRRFDKPALILVPTITIREQWADRIKTAFLSHASEAERLVSQDLKTPKMITIATYQALHSALTQYKGKLSNLSEEEGVLTENVDFSQFDLVNKLQEIGLGTLCLDECHHLRNEWWKSLEEFRDKYSQLNLIALTATPPYDSEPALWDRYINLCGEIDEEIMIPELVKEGSICPHQDFVYFSYPDKEEKDFFNKSVFSDMMRDMQETIDFLHKENKELALEIIKLRDEKRELENRENLYEKKSPPFFSFEPSFDNAEEESPLVPIYYNQEEEQDDEKETFVEEIKPLLEYKLVDQYYRNCIVCFYTKQEEEYVLSKELYIFNFHDYTLRLIRCLNEIFSRENYQRTVNKYGREYVMSDYIPYSKKDIKNFKLDPANAHRLYGVSIGE